MGGHGDKGQLGLGEGVDRVSSPLCCCCGCCLAVVVVVVVGSPQPPLPFCVWDDPARLPPPLSPPFKLFKVPGGGLQRVRLPRGSKSKKASRVVDVAAGAFHSLAVTRSVGRFLSVCVFVCVCVCLFGWHSCGLWQLSMMFLGRRKDGGSGLVVSYAAPKHTIPLLFAYSHPHAHTHAWAINVLVTATCLRGASEPRASWVWAMSTVDSPLSASSSLHGPLLPAWVPEPCSRSSWRETATS